MLLIYRNSCVQAHFAFARAASRRISVCRNDVYSQVPPVLQRISCAKQGQLFEKLAKEAHASQGWHVSDPQPCFDLNGKCLAKGQASYDYLISPEVDKDF
eukprot:3128752-Amphidinium_carterae.1